ncbi:MAG: DUF4115 domain-containing protein, partial [Burkholderiales bacterium]|nr:DUF4115 domain-containing protein [Burkholderiales bacterium]
PGDAAAPDPAAPAAATTQAAVGLRASAESWVEARDADGRVVFSRTLRAGESVELDAAPPLRLTIGNAAATELTLRGQPVDLAPHLSGNVARIELK